MFNKSTIELARRMFVKDNCDIENIAKQLGVSSATIRAWRTKGQWDHEKENAVNVNYIAEDAYRFAGFLRNEIEKLMTNGMMPSKEQIKVYEILTARIESLIRVDIERKKANKNEVKSDDYPEDFRRIPRVAQAYLTINKAWAEYQKKTSSKGENE